VIEELQRWVAEVKAMAEHLTSTGIPSTGRKAGTAGAHEDEINELRDSVEIEFGELSIDEPRFVFKIRSCLPTDWNPQFYYPQTR